MAHSRRLFGFPTVVAALFCAVALSTAPAVHAAGPVRRIVSLSPGITEMVYALGLGGRLVGDTDYCDYPPAATRIAHVGGSGGGQFDYEKILSLQPDLVIADSVADEQALPRLRALHAPLLVLSVQSIHGVEAGLHRIAAAAGVPAAGDRVVSTMRAQETQAVRLARGATRRRLRVLVVAGVNPLYVAGEATFIGRMLARLGVVDLAGPEGFAPMSLETATADDPQVIVCGADEAGQVKRMPGLSATAAVSRGNVFAIDSDLIFRPGPRLTLGMLAIARRLAKAR